MDYNSCIDHNGHEADFNYLEKREFKQELLKRSMETQEKLVTIFNRVYHWSKFF